MSETMFKQLLLGDEKGGEDTAAIVEAMLLADETVEFATKGLRDGAAFTDKRIIIVNRQGIMGKKIELASIPLKSITAFSIENSGTFDLDAEVKIWGSGWGAIQMTFTKGFPVLKVGQYLGRVL